ncbi:unnamed protein product [Amoebophrya sp. A25]|nr:unnamed protein product [Amoebophrya sp. A25]|eukprot:GSA25T00011132001.1
MSGKLEERERPKPNAAVAASLHFYTSTLPCGEAALCPTSADRTDCNRTGAKKMTWSFGSAPIGEGIGEEKYTTTSTAIAKMKKYDANLDINNVSDRGALRTKPIDSRHDESLRSTCMSCSDKIMRWNHCGWGGIGCLSMSSIVVGGSLFEEEHVANALFRRGESCSKPVLLDEEEHYIPDEEPKRRKLSAEEGRTLERVDEQPAVPDKSMRQPRFLHTERQFSMGKPDTISKNPAALGLGQLASSASTSSTCGYSIVFVEQQSFSDGVTCSSTSTGSNTPEVPRKISGRDVHEVLLSVQGMKQGGDKARKAGRDLRKFESALCPRRLKDSREMASVERRDFFEEYRRRKEIFHRVVPLAQSWRNVSKWKDRTSSERTTDHLEEQERST